MHYQTSFVGHTAHCSKRASLDTLPMQYQTSFAGHPIHDNNTLPVVAHEFHGTSDANEFSRAPYPQMQTSLVGHPTQ